MAIPKALEPHLKGIYEIVSGASADYQALYPIEAKVVHSPGCRAHNKHCHMLARAALYAATEDGVQMFESKGLHGIVIDQEYAIRFKKLDDDLHPRNQPTQQVQDYRDQKEIEGIPAVHKLEAGYTENQMTGEIAGVHLVYPSGKGNKWDTELLADQTPVIAELFEEEEGFEEADLVPRRDTGEVIPIIRKKEDDNKN